MVPKIIKTKKKKHFYRLHRRLIFNTPCAKHDFVHVRIKKHSLKQALYTSYQKIRKEKMILTSCDLLNVTRIKSLSRTSIEMYYFGTPCRPVFACSLVYPGFARFALPPGALSVAYLACADEPRPLEFRLLCRDSWERHCALPTLPQ